MTKNVDQDDPVISTPPFRIAKKTEIELLKEEVYLRL